MKKKRILQYLAVITSMVALSIATPLVIRSASDWIVRRVSARNRAPETEETGENEETNNVPDESLNNDPDNSGEKPEEEPAAEGGEEPSDDETEGEPEEPLTNPEAEGAEETAEEGEQAEEVRERRDALGHVAHELDAHPVVDEEVGRV